MTEHIHRFRRWRSLKAYTILNGLEIVFWAVVTFLTMKANTRICIGTSCGLGWVIFVLAATLRYAISANV
jgi:hypothetical protein